MAGTTKIKARNDNNECETGNSLNILNEEFDPGSG